MKHDDKELMLRRKKRAFDLACLGLTHEEIRQKFDEEGIGGITRQRVTQLLDQVYKKAEAELIAMAMVEKARQLQRAVHVHKEAMAAWEASKKPQKTITSKQSGSGKDAVVTVKESCGEPRFLDVAMKAQAEISKLMGLYAPARAELSGELTVYDRAERSMWAGASAQELEALASIASQIEARAGS